jgi:hypothetical protein
MGGRAMKTPSPTLALCGGLALSMLGASLACLGGHAAQVARQAQAQSVAQGQQLAAEQARQQQMATEWQALDAAFKRLIAQGVFQSERPSKTPEWIARLQQEQTRLGIPVLRYEFQPPEPLPEDGDYFERTPLTLTLGLNHELEFSMLLHTLTAQTEALVRIHECELRVNPERPDPVQPGVNLLAHCTLDWITGHLSAMPPPEKTQEAAP